MPETKNETPENRSGSKSAEVSCYAFQCFMNNKMEYDTGLITLDEAKSLWSSVEKEFTKCCSQGQDAEMAIWMDMKEPGDYREKYKGVCSSDVVILNGTAYTQEPVFG